MSLLGLKDALHSIRATEANAQRQATVGTGIDTSKLVLSDIPSDLLLDVISYLPVNDILRLRRVRLSTSSTCCFHLNLPIPPPFHSDMSDDPHTHRQSCGVAFSHISPADSCWISPPRPEGAEYRKPFGNRSQVSCALCYSSGLHMAQSVLDAQIP